MSAKPGTRHFIGPLTPAQQERRRIARYRGNDAAEIASSRYVSFLEGLRILDDERRNRFNPFRFLA